jgi:hypothetical protein
MSLRNGQHAMFRCPRAMTGCTPMMNECSQDSEAIITLPLLKDGHHGGRLMQSMGDRRILFLAK